MFFETSYLAKVEIEHVHVEFRTVGFQRGFYRIEGDVLCHTYSNSLMKICFPLCYSYDIQLQQ